MAARDEVHSARELRHDGFEMGNLDSCPNTRLRCFVAIAFGYPDTDRLFEQIRRALEEIDVIANRIDQIEHNDDIDDRIILEIERADFVLADLTYARPSVYFEAGFAQRSAQVVYTVRSDHFQPRMDDPQGNLRVLFDLQMKNIIAWKTPEDRQFLKRLKSRVKKIVAPIRRQKASSAEATMAIEAFQSKSVQHRRGFLQETVRSYFEKRRGYHVVELGKNSRESEDYDTPAMLVLSEGSLVGTKREGSKLMFFFFQVVPSISKMWSGQYQYGLIQHHLYGAGLFKRLRWVPSKIREDIIVCSFGTGGVARLARDIPYLSSGEWDATLQCQQTTRIDLDGRSVQAERQINIHIIESIPRLAKLEQQLRSRFE